MQIPHIIATMYAWEDTVEDTPGALSEHCSLTDKLFVLNYINIMQCLQLYRKAHYVYPLYASYV